SFNTSGFVQISSTAGTQWETIEFPNPVVIGSDGYVLIYVSNETNAANVIEFDNLSITHREPLAVIQADDYYPFGLTFNSFTRSYSEPQRYKYNGKEQQEETNWIDFGARMHMPDIARFTTIDPLAEKFSSQSPYVYAANNPVRFIEVNGESPADQRPPNVIPILKSYNSSSKRLNFAVTNKQFYPSTKERASRLLQKAKHQKNMQNVNKVAGADGGPAVLGLVSAAVDIPLSIRKGQILMLARAYPYR
ncbi:MAG: RHS repeat-associated core domain-containing protein, partial [Cytophagales bacterium]|nr:RHS repeat-associated core domain-containing protein [Cytophagales bacterium]